MRWRIRAGKFLIGAGLLTVGSWGWYLLDQEFIDAWYTSAFLVPLTLILIGLKLAPIRRPSIKPFRVSYKRDLALTFAVAALIELGLAMYLNTVAEPKTPFYRLTLLQEPGLRIGLAISSTRIITSECRGLVVRQLPLRLRY